MFEFSRDYCVNFVIGRLIFKRSSRLIYIREPKRIFFTLLLMAKNKHVLDHFAYRPWRVIQLDHNVVVSVASFNQIGKFSIFFLRSWLIMHQKDALWKDNFGV